MSDVIVRQIEPADLDTVLALNQAHVPAVGEIDRPRLQRLVEQAETAVLAELDGRLAGFVIALPPGVDYDSPNYGWFSERYDDFVYVDRVAVDGTLQRSGVGHLLYDTVQANTNAAVLCCEVNLRPPNEPSLRFHERRGFEAVGEQDAYGGATRVVLLARRLRDEPMSVMHLDVTEGRLAICRLAPDADVPDWSVGTGFISMTRTRDELSIVVAEDSVPAGIRAERGWRALVVRGPLEFSLTGVIASIAQPLADAGLPVFVISTFDTDWILVRNDQLDEVVRVLRAAGHHVSG